MAVRENQDGDSEQELDGLEDIHTVSCPAAVDSEEAICVTLHGILVRVHCHEDFPELESRAAQISDWLHEKQDVTYYMAKPPKTVYKATPGP